MAVERIDYTSDQEYLQALAWEREEEEAWQEQQWAEEQAARMAEEDHTLNIAIKSETEVLVM